MNAPDDAPRAARLYHRVNSNTVASAAAGPAAAELDEKVLAALAAGCAFYGGGGGGDPTIGLLMAVNAVRLEGPVPIVGLADLDPDALVLPAAFVGAPTVVMEKFAGGHEGRHLRAIFEERTGRTVAALMAAEIGGLNGVLPAAWAAWARLPVVDADLIGRAFPRLHMTTANLGGISASPIAIVDERDNVVVVDAVDNAWAERLTRAVSSELGGTCSTVMYPMTVSQARTVAVERSLSRAIKVGRLLDTPGGLAAVLEAVAGFELLQGSVRDIERRTSSGFSLGHAIVEGLGSHEGQLLRLEFQNEITAALIDGRFRACVPDVTTVLDLHTGRPIMLEQLRYGQRVSVVALPCDDILRTPRGLELWGPQAFGYDFAYVPVEQLNSSVR